MDMFTSPIHLAGTLAELHRHDLEIEIETERRRRLVEPVHRRTIDILIDARALIGAFLVELMPWPGGAADPDRRAADRERVRHPEGLRGDEPRPRSVHAPCPPAAGSRAATTGC